MLTRFCLSVLMFFSVSEKEPRTYMPSDIDAVVLIETLFSRCSGTVVADGVVATAAHCVDAYEGPIFVVFADGSMELFKAVYVGQPGSRSDIALLKGNTKGTEAMPVADSMGELPEGCFAFGFNGTEKEKMMPCFLTEDMGALGIMGIGEVLPGDSGGPVIGRDGKMVGVIWGGDEKNPFLMIIAPLEELRKALAAINKL